MATHSLAHHFLTETYNNAWANHRLLRACCELTPAEFTATRTSLFPSIKAMLHFEPEEPLTDCAELSSEQHATGCGASSRTSSSTRSTIAARRTRCSPACA